MADPTPLPPLAQKAYDGLCVADKKLLDTYRALTPTGDQLSRATDPALTFNKGLADLKGSLAANSAMAADLDPKSQAAVHDRYLNYLDLAEKNGFQTPCGVPDLSGKGTVKGK